MIGHSHGEKDLIIFADFEVLFSIYWPHIDVYNLARTLKKDPFGLYRQTSTNYRTAIDVASYMSRCEVARPNPI